jgi:hypothetical protein
MYDGFFLILILNHINRLVEINSFIIATVPKDNFVVQNNFVEGSF